MPDRPRRHVHDLSASDEWMDDDADDSPDDAGVMPRPGDSGAAVDQLLDEVEADTDPRGMLTVGGLRGRTALVTGGSSGIGRAVAMALARCGSNIAFTYLAEDESALDAASEVAAEMEACRVRVFHRAVDCADPVGMGLFVQDAIEELGGLHILVNNAGIGRDRALWRMTDEEWEAVIRTNLTGTFVVTRAVAPHFRAQEYGKIVNISSVHGIRSEFGLANYAASKAGILALTRSTAVELGPSNVNVNAVAPGYIRTTQLTARVPSEILDRARERSVLGRLGDPQDVAGVVLFLCSEAARHITGAVIPVDGGYVL